MMRPGEFQELEMIKLRDQGAYLAEAAEEGNGSGSDGGRRETVLLPGKQIPEGAGIGSKIRVFIYRDSSDRLIATTTEPKLTLHKVARLSVKETTKIGAFLDWGLEKDLLLPFREQTRKVQAGDSVLAALYIDKSGRLAATMKVYPYLKLNSPYVIGDSVKGSVYQIAENFGVFVAVDDQYSGMIPKRDAQAGFAVGQELTLRVTGVKEDGKLDLSSRDKAYLEINQDAEAVLEKIRDDYRGCLPFDDKADPEVIREAFGLSKAAFKRAIGHLYKEHLVEIADHQIRLL